MNKIFITLFCLGLAAAFTAGAQIATLPYTTGFDSPADRTGWVEFRTGSTGYHGWSLSGAGGPTPPNFISHDYPVGGTGDSVADWFVSPRFDFSSGGRIDSMKVDVYAIIGSATPDDEFRIFLLQGSPDPGLATSITELADLTNMASSASSWRDTGVFVIPPVSGDCYIALKYRATTNWFTLKVDNIGISGAATAIPETGIAGVRVFPNPASRQLSIAYDEPAKLELRMYSITGIPVFSKIWSGSTTIVLDLPPGIYTYQITNNKLHQNGKLTIQ